MRMARRRRRRSGKLGYAPRAGSPFLAGPPARRRRTHRTRTGPSLPLSTMFTLVVLVAALGVGAYYLVREQLKTDHRPAALSAFVAAWEKGDHAAMWRLLDAKSRTTHSQLAFTRDYDRSDRAATVKSVDVGTLTPIKNGMAGAPVTVRTRYFGTLRGTIRFHVHEEGETARIAWTPDMRLPGLKPGEEVRRVSGREPTRGIIFAACGQLLASDPTGASIAGSSGTKPTGLERIYDDRLGGRRSSILRFGDRVIAKVPRIAGKSVHTTIRLGLQKTAQSALGGKLGGVAVIKPSDGSVLALAGLAVSGPAAARLARSRSSRSPRRSSTASPRRAAPIRCARPRPCQASSSATPATSPAAAASPSPSRTPATPSSARSARSLGAKRLVAAAEASASTSSPTSPAAKPSTIPKASDLKDAIAVGASAIGQNKDLATPLGMASVGATIAQRRRACEAPHRRAPSASASAPSARRSPARCAT